MTKRTGIRGGLSALTLVGALSCSGVIDGPGAGPGEPSGAAGAGGGLPPLGGNGGNGGNVLPGQCSPTASLAPARVWRLTDEQYVNVVAQVFGVRVPPEVTEPVTHPGEFTNLSEVRAAEARTVGAYESAARLAARGAIAANLSAFLPCSTTAPTDACVERFIQNRVARAFGRPLTATEAQDLMALYKLGVPESPAAGIRMVIEATLQAPSFLYRTEVGGGAATAAQGKVKLSAHELATAVSFALLDSVPDDSLWAKAQDGSLTKPAVLAAEIDRLMKLPVVKANLSRQAGYWLGVERLHETEKDSAVFPEFTAGLKQSLYQSARLFVQDVITGGNVNDLLTSRRMYLNADLAKAYGVTGVTGTDLAPIEVSNPERGAGILTQPAVLTAFSRPNRGDPIHRGLFVYYSLVCGTEIPPPPEGALQVAGTFPKDATERELSNLRTKHATCGPCHSLFDPLGLTTEQYDAIGRYRASDAKGPIDSSATLSHLGPDLDGPVAGLPELVEKLRKGRRVSDCAATNLAVAVLGKTVADDHSCALQAVRDDFAKTGSFLDYYRSLLTSPGFATRDVAP